MSKQILLDDYKFNGLMKPPAVGSVTAGPWASAVTATNGTVTVQTISGGTMQLSLDATDEVQSACLYMGDVLPYGINDLVELDIWASLSTLDITGSPVLASFGLATARNNTPASMAEYCLWQVNSGNALNLSTSDGVNVNSLLATGYTLSTGTQRHNISFKEGVYTQGPPGLSLGGTANIVFSVEDVRGNLKRVLTQNRVDMSNYAGNLQLFAQLQKTAAAKSATLNIRRIRAQYRYNYPPVGTP